MPLGSEVERITKKNTRRIEAETSRQKDVERDQQTNKEQQRQEMKTLRRKITKPGGAVQKRTSKDERKEETDIQGQDGPGPRNNTKL